MCTARETLAKSVLPFISALIHNPKLSEYLTMYRNKMKSEWTRSWSVTVKATDFFLCQGTKSLQIHQPRPYHNNIIKR